VGKIEKEIAELKEQLKAVLSSHTRLQEEFEAQRVELERKNEIIAALQKRLFGSSSERLDPMQIDLQFKEGEKLLGKSEPVEEDGENEITGSEDSSGLKALVKRRKKKELFPRNLPVLSEKIIIPREVLEDPQSFVEIGEEDPHDELEVVRARIGWNRTRRKKYKRKEDRTKPPVVAPAPEPSIPGTLCGPILMSQLIADKHLDHLPHYRQSGRILRQSGVELSRGTINAWVHAAAEHLKPIGEVIKCSLARSRILQIDETPMKYLDPGMGKASQGYLWVYRDPETGMVWFDWRLGRGGVHLEEMLGKDKKGNLLWDVEIIQSDGYKVYLALAAKVDELKLAACLAHIRRKFFDAMDESPEYAGPIMEGIQKLYRIEYWFREGDTPLACRELIRRTQSRGVCEQLLAEITALGKLGHLPQSRLGQALTYALGRWNEMETYLSDARVPIDNNLIENAIRPAKLGLKNYLFFGSAEAGVNNALLYTLIANCKAAQINPELYFEEVFRRLPMNATPEQAAELTPEKLAPEILSREELRQIA
jgi:transposase